MPFGRMGWNPLEVIEQITYLLFIRRLGEKETSIAFNYTQVQRGEKLEQNIQLKSGDVVMVP